MGSERFLGGDATICTATLYYHDIKSENSINNILSQHQALKTVNEFGA